jgi:hypothetical protein
MDRSECVHGILHDVRPRERFRSWECEASSHRFSINGLLPQKRREDACALQKSRDCGTKHNAQKFAQARHGEFVLWRTAKIFIDSSTGIKNSLSVIPSKVACQAVALCEGLEESLDIFPILLPGTRARLPQLGRFFFAALDLQHHALRSTGSECADGGTHSAR